MTFIELEQEKLELTKLLPHIFGKTILFKIAGYYSFLLETKDNYLIEAFSLDFIEEFIAALKSFSPYCTSPEKTKSLLELLGKIKSVSTLSEYQNEIDGVIHIINIRLEELRDILNGHTSATKNRNIVFPLIEHSLGSETFGTLESVSIKINKTKSHNKFVFVPTEKQIEERLHRQAQVSFEFVLNYFQKYKKKFSRYHEILIYFENLSANYEGNSLGVALTVGFIEQLSVLYNLPFITNIKNNIATTGGVDENGSILPLSKEIIEKKIEVVFFSAVESFVVPKEEEEFALKKKQQLKEKYPDRKLKLIAIEHISELINRRDLVSIKKQPTIVRAAKGVKKSWIASTLFLIILLILIFIYIREFDNNPYSVEPATTEIIIKNKSSRTIWSINNPILSTKSDGARAIESVIRILDINNDGVNEVLNAFTHTSRFSDGIISDGLVLLNYKGEIIWRRSFRKKLTSKREILTPPFGTFIFDTLSINKELCVLCGSNNVNSYASAVYILNLKRNLVVSDTLWNSGHIMDVRVVDLNNNKKKELIVLAHNNGLQKLSLFHLDIDELKGQVPTADEYKLFNINNAHLLHCFVFPNTDYSRFMNQRFSSTKYRCLELDYTSMMVRLVTIEGGLDKGGIILYNWYYEKNDFDIAIGSDLRVMRDTLVAHSKLPLPYTDTQEYRELLRSQVQAWDGKKFVKREELK